MVACRGRSIWSLATDRSRGREGRTKVSSFTCTGWLPTRYPKLARRLTDEELNDLVRMAGALKKDIHEDVTRFARRVTHR